MSGAAKARGKARARRGSIREIRQADERTPGPVATYDLEVRGAVPAQRPVHGLEPVPVPVSQDTVKVGQVVAVPEQGSAAQAQPGPSGAFARGYAAPADAVRCAMLGSPPTFWFDGDAGRLTIAVESGRLTASGVVHIDEDLAQLVAAVLLNHDGEPADAVEPMRAALAELATLAGQREAEVTVDLSGSSPRLGWLSRFDPAPWVTWHDWWAAFAASPAGRTAAAVGASGSSAEVDECFRRQGLRVVRCAEPGCAAPLTDRHPTWNGVWSAASGTRGPVCAVACEGRGWPAGQLTARPHRVTEA